MLASGWISNLVFAEDEFHGGKAEADLVKLDSSSICPLANISLSLLVYLRSPLSLFKRLIVSLTRNFIVITAGRF